MPLSVEQFIENLSQTGLMSAAEVSTLCDRLPPAEQPVDGEALAKLLICHGKLTKYQAQVIYSGTHENLVFDEYVVLDKLGAGGMGVVFKAQHRRMKRVVAIKVLPSATMKNQDAIDRFYREVEAAAKLNHPHIVTAHDAGEHAGMHFLVMEYVEGQDLGQIVAQRGPLPVAQAIECILQAAKGLEYAHAMGVVHRDIKPGNLLLTKDGQIKILDMGLASLGEVAGPEAATAAQLTQSGQIMGTVDYMSPEQAQDSHRADARSDIYSLGCTLYRLLTGEPPYPGETVMNRMMAHQQAPIPSLCARRDDVPAALDAAFQRMIAKVPGKRQQSMGQVIADLKVGLSADAAQRYVAAEPSSASGLGDLFRTASGESVTTKPQSATAAEQETLSRTGRDQDTGKRLPVAPVDAVSQTARPARRRSVFWLALAGSALAALVLLSVVVWRQFVGTPTKLPNGNGAEEPSIGLTIGETAGQEWDGNGLKMKFCWCPPGQFTMGSPKEEPNRAPDGSEDQVQVTLSKGFWLGKYEVTQGQYRQVMKSNPSCFSAGGAAKDAVVGLDTHKFPVEMVAWNEATEFCRALTQQEQLAGRMPAGWEYRLPTEAQWEYACRAGTQTAYSFGDGASRLEDHAWYEANSEKRSHEVGQKQANPWGLHDMHGNVSEWCRDWRKDKLLGGSDPEVTEQASHRVLRGGDWFKSGGDCRSAYRYGIRPVDGASLVGFRVAAVQLSAPATATPLLGTRAGQEWDGNDLKMKFCWCPPGTFTMGSPPTEPDRNDRQVEATLSGGFWLGKYEVTQREFESLMKAHPWTWPEAVVKKTDREVVKRGDDYPATYVNWDDAVQFCAEYTRTERAASRLPAGWEYRLPTEAQWEYACRARETARFSFGADEARLGEYAWFRKNARDVGENYPHQVGQKGANPWGLHDMHGNVSEWCRDGWAKEHPGGTDPEVTEPANLRVFRGGGYGDEGGNCRSASRSRTSPALRLDGLGFRVALVQVDPFAGTKPGQEWSGNGLKMKFCWCPPGKFTMGSPKEEPGRAADGSEDQVQVTLSKGFWLGKYEVTQGDWARIMKTTLREQRDKADKSNLLYGEDADYPMYYVNHDEVQDFCRTLTGQERRAGKLPADWEYRLPTEAQWEYACRAGTKTATAFGDKLSSEQANFNGESPYNGADKGEFLSRAAKVGNYKANDWGLHDMHGNVREWCRDWYKAALPGGTDPEPTERTFSPMHRGGSWNANGTFCRSATRNGSSPGYRLNDLGFRVALVQSR